MIENELEHFGVKGMKWGVRKSDPKSPSKSDLIKADRKSARSEMKTIRKEMVVNRARAYHTRHGSPANKRLRSEYRDQIKAMNQARKRTKVLTPKEKVMFTVGVGSLFAASALISNAPEIANSVATRRGAAAARNLFADNNGITSYPTISLAFDAAAGVHRFLG